MAGLEFSDFTLTEIHYLCLPVDGIKDAELPWNIYEVELHVVSG